ncbi:MAG: hypothetical protein PGN29_16255 [Gordonia paraffinivorans]
MTTLATTTPTPTTDRTAVPTRGLGILLAIGATAWAAVLPIVGDAEGFGPASLIGGLVALVFQVAVIWLLTVQYRTAAMGDGRVARGFYRAEFVVMAGALVSTTFDGLGVLHGTPVWAVFDTCWPLSMFGLLGIGIRVAIAGRWTGILRWWTVGAQSWFALVPLAMLGGPVVIVAGVHAAIGYGVLGILLARADGLTRREDGGVVSLR